MIMLERNIARLLWGVGKADEVAVFDRVLRPREYVRSQLISHFVNFTKTMFEDDDDPELIVLPSDALRRLQYCTAAMQKCSSHLDIEFSSLLRETLFEQSCETEVYDVSTVIKATPGIEGSGDRNVHKVVKHYVRLIEASGNSECVYSASIDSFIKNPDPVVKKKFAKNSSPGLESFATPSELQSLILVIGTQGARVLDSALLALVSSHVSKIKGVISDNEAPLSQLRVTFADGAALEGVKNCSELVASSVIVGNALCLRKMLHSATGATQKNTVPLINSALSLAAASISHDENGGGMTPSVISLAKSSGVEVGGLDPSLSER